MLYDLLCAQLYAFFLRKRLYGYFDEESLELILREEHLFFFVEFALDVLEVVREDSNVEIGDDLALLRGFRVEELGLYVSLVNIEFGIRIFLHSNSL